MFFQCTAIMISTYEKRRQEGTGLERAVSEIKVVFRKKRKKCGAIRGSWAAGRTQQEEKTPQAEKEGSHPAGGGCGGRGRIRRISFDEYRKRRSRADLYRERGRPAGYQSPSARARSASANRSARRKRTSCASLSSKRVRPRRSAV